jgi:hypothetical protein
VSNRRNSINDFVAAPARTLSQIIVATIELGLAPDAAVTSHGQPSSANDAKKAEGGVAA